MDLDTDEEWLTWPQAAELVGCPVPTVEYYTRIGRIERRPNRLGRQPSLKRSSVVSFGVWWRTETARRKTARAARPKPQPSGPPDPTGWISTKDAVGIIGCRYADHVLWLARRGDFEARKVGNRWWVREAGVRSYVDERDRWVSWTAAGKIVGCSHETIRRAVQAGQIEKRPVRTRASLLRESVEAFARVFNRTESPHGT